MVITVYSPLQSENFFWRKPLLGFLFGMICVLGMLAVIFPRACSDKINCSKKEPSTSAHSVFSNKKYVMRGHHPNCDRFSAHVFQMRGRTFCAGCAGLFIGGAAAFIGALLYFFLNLNFEQLTIPIYYVGAIGVCCGLLLPILNTSRSLLRLFLNAYFAFGCFLLLAAVDMMTQNVFVDLFLFILIIFWLFTRIVLSFWNHERICNSCKLKICKANPNAIAQKVHPRK